MIRQLTMKPQNWLLILVILSSASVESITAQGKFASLKPIIAETNIQADPYRSEFFRVDRHPEVTINTLSGDIEVVENSGIGGVQIDLYVKREFSLWSGTRNLDNYRIIMQKQGNSVVASVEDKRSGRDARSSGGIQFTFLVQVPAEASLSLRSIDGDILAKGVEGRHFVQNHAGTLNLQHLTGEVRAASTAGDILLNHLSGSVYAKSVSGSIRSEGDRGEVRLRTISGDISAKNMTGTLVAGTTSGNIVSDFREVSVGVYLETTTGDIDLLLPARSGYSISAKGMNFNFDELTGEQVSKDVRFMNASIEIGEGEIPVDLQSISGSIRVRQTQ